MLNVAAATGSVVAAKDVVAKALVLKLLTPAARGFYSLMQLGLCCSLLLNLLLHDLSSFHNRLSSDHLLLYQAKAFILLVKALQLVSIIASISSSESYCTSTSISICWCRS
jgi:hypothetical protein